MATRSQNHLSIVEAVETLSNIADLEFDHEIGIAQKHEVIINNEKIAYKTVHWLHKKEASSTVKVVREIFRLILHYLKQFYQQEYKNITDSKTLEGIKTVMVLVGEAAKKLDKYTQLFQQTQSVTEFKEYQQLQEFYKNKIARKVEEGALSKIVLRSLGKIDKGVIFHAAPKKTDKLTETKHIFVDLEAVKKDTEYELFLIRKEDGSRFFSPRLLRNIKLVCDFGSYFGERKESDPLENIRLWNDHYIHTCAKEMLKMIGSRLDHFFRDIRQTKKHEIIEKLNKALLALMFSAHSRNLMRHQPAKSCTEYFEDFQGFLRDILQSEIYQKWIQVSPKENNELAYDLLDLLHTLCYGLYASLQGLEDFKATVRELIHESKKSGAKESKKGAKKSNKVAAQLSEDYSAMAKLIKHHPNGPLLKIMHLLDESSFHAFDSLLQHNLPGRLFELYLQDKYFQFLRIPSPTYQEFINKAIINEEFKAFIRQCSQGAIPRKHLLINLQDRTAWREYARCLAIENYQNEPEAEKALCVVTLAVNTDFYHQRNPYHQISHADVFKSQFKEQLLDEHAGYYFSPKIDKKELEKFIDPAFEKIHQLFFSSKNVLTRENRLDFIEIFYFVLQLKMIEWTQSDTISLTCKDAIDTGEAFQAGLFVFLKLINNQEWTEADWDHVNAMLYGPALLMRERIMQPDRFNRMQSALNAVENAKEEAGNGNFTKAVQKQFQKLFSTPILHSQILLPRQK